jgi:cobalt/nickel transport system ATP-binding protein
MSEKHSGRNSAGVKQALFDTETTNLEDNPTYLLSYGQKKRVSIASVLAMEPEVIIIDEPTVLN